VGVGWYVAFSPDGRLLAAASGDGSAQTWDAATGKAVLTLQGHTKGVTSLAFSPDSRTLTTASDDNTARIWNAATGKEIFTLRGHSGGVTSVAYSPDGRLLATASLDKTAKIWDAATGKEILTLRGHESGRSGGIQPGWQLARDRELRPYGKDLGCGNGQGNPYASRPLR
jgi:WD40 repeat protein